MAERSKATRLDILGAFAAGVGAALLGAAVTYTLLKKQQPRQRTPTTGDNGDEDAKNARADALNAPNPTVGTEFAEYTTVDAEELRAFASACLVAAGCADANAAVVADVLLAVRQC